MCSEGAFRLQHPDNLASHLRYALRSEDEAVRRACAAARDAELRGAAYTATRETSSSVWAHITGHGVLVGLETAIAQQQAALQPTPLVAGPSAAAQGAADVTEEQREARLAERDAKRRRI